MAVLLRSKSSVYNLTTDLTNLANLISTNTTNITNEITRATGAEATLQTNIDNEVTRATGVEGDLVNLTTIAKTNLVSAINEIASNVSSMAGFQSELDATQAGAGLGTDGTYTANATSNYIASATSLVSADELLDAQINTVTANVTAEATARNGADVLIQSELDATQSGAGLGTDGSYTSNVSSNFIVAATSLANADDLLDAQAQFNAVAIVSLDNATLKIASNLGDLGDVVTARTNLGVYSTAEVDNAITTAGLALGTNWSAANAAGASVDFTAGDLSVGDNVYLSDDGDTKWAIYKITAITDGAWGTSTIEKIMDEDVYLNAQSAAAIKASYESNANTNEFSDEEQAQVARLGTSSTVLDTTATQVLLAINELVADDVGIQTEIDTTQTGAGLAGDGTYVVNATSNYITTATSLANADNLLDAQINTNATNIGSVSFTNLTSTDLTSAIDEENVRALTVETSINDSVTAEATARANADTTIQSELDATQSGAGLGTDGSYTANAATNYIGAVTSLTGADEALDTTLKSLSDNTYTIAETDAAIAAGGAVFITESLTVTADAITLTHAAKSDMLFNFNTVRHTDANGISYDIPATAASANSTTYNLSPDTSGQFNGVSVIVQYAYVPV